MEKKWKVIVGLLLIIFVAVIVVVLSIGGISGKKTTKLQQVVGITVVPTMRDKITADSSWCGTFQLVWNDMKNGVVGKDIIFSPQLPMVENLNKEEFKASMLSEDHYFKAYGIKTLELRDEIVNGIKDKFNQKSDVIDDFDWSEDELDNSDIRRYFFYTMLYRKFDFLQQFDTLKKASFGKKYNDVEYFGIDSNTEESVGDQIDVLYYHSKEDFAIILNTKTEDEVIFCKSPKGDSFKSIYENMNIESDKYTGSKSFNGVDEFKAPKLTFDEKKEYKELANKPFEIVDSNSGEIEKAIQTIKFTLDEKGGEIKSEAAIEMSKNSIGDSKKVEKPKPRYFYVDDTCAIFLREKGKQLPYFAGRIEDITKFQ